MSHFLNFRESRALKLDKSSVGQIINMHRDEGVIFSQEFLFLISSLCADPRLNREPKGVNRGSEGIQRRSSVGSNQQLPHVVAFNPIVTAQTSSSSTPYPYLHKFVIFSYGSQKKYSHKVNEINSILVCI